MIRAMQVEATFRRYATPGQIVTTMVVLGTLLCLAVGGAAAGALPSGFAATEVGAAVAVIATAAGLAGASSPLWQIGRARATGSVRDLSPVFFFILAAGACSGIYWGIAFGHVAAIIPNVVGLSTAATTFALCSWPTALRSGARAYALLVAVMLVGAVVAAGGMLAAGPHGLPHGPGTVAATVLLASFGGLGSASPILQLARIVRLRSAADVSLPFLFVFGNGYLTWLVYGAVLHSVVLVVLNSVSVGLIVPMILIARRLESRPVTRPA
jgi:uncharacterized protein with PQ loop repeat